MKQILALIFTFLFTTAFWSQNTQSTKYNTQENPNEDSFYNITKKGHYVYIDSQDAGVIAHATEALNIWGYWNVTNKRSEANFYLRFNFLTIRMGDKTGKAVFINPTTNKIIKETKSITTDIKKDLNTKRQIVYRLVNEEIKSLYK